MNEIKEKARNVSFLDGILAADSEVPEPPKAQHAASETDGQKSIPEPRDAGYSVKPISERKLAANRENAKFSTGPKTAKGKAVSSSNSTRHGIFSRNLICQGEQNENDWVAFEEIQNAMSEHYHPEGAIEKVLVEKIAVEAWRFSRLLAFEQKELSQKSPFWGQGVDRVLRYQAGINRQFFQAVEQLERLQAARKGEAEVASQGNKKATRP